MKNMNIILKSMLYTLTDDDEYGVNTTSEAIVAIVAYLIDALNGVDGMRTEVNLLKTWEIYMPNGENNMVMTLLRKWIDENPARVNVAYSVGTGEVIFEQYEFYNQDANLTVVVYINRM